MHACIHTQQTPYKNVGKMITFLKESVTVFIEKMEETKSDLFESLVDRVKLLGLFWKLGSDVSTNEDSLQVHPFSLNHHPHLHQ